MPSYTPTGLALYLRAISSDHGTPKQLAKKFADHGATWVAIGGPWHDARTGKRGLMNKPETVKRYADAFHERDIEPYVWGYPWQGSEELFADQMHACSGEYLRALLDPELGSNPEHATKGSGKRRADEHATKLVTLMSQRFAGGVCGLSTFGSGVRMKWFPLRAFAIALSEHFPMRSFLGGQTYTDDKNIDPSIADFLRVIDELGGVENIALVPNFGTYAWVPATATKKRRARSKTPTEMDAHFMEFIDEEEPVDALIGWAENFMTPPLWTSFARMAERMQRGACRL